MGNMLTTTARGEEMPTPPAREQLALLRRLFRDPTPVLDELAGNYGPVVGLGAGPLRIAIVGDPAAIGDMFALPTDSFRWNHRFNVLGFVVGKGSMIVSDGEDHRRRRAAVQSGFSRRRVNRLVPMIVGCVDDAVDRAVEAAGAARPVDLYPVARRLTLDVVVRSLFGERMAGRVDEIGDLFERPQAYLESPAIRQLPHPFPFTARSKVRDDRRALDALIDEEIAIRRRERAEDQDDLLAVLAADDSLSDAEVRDQVDTLIGAGYHSTTASLSWMLWRAALEEGVWSALRDEADPAFAADDWDHTLLTRLDLAGRVMRETLRLHPAGVVGLREAVQDVEIGGYRIPRGTMILWSSHLSGRDPDAWPDPLRFDPGRFATAAADRSLSSSGAWAPFGGGARNCVGFAIAQTELTLAISRIAQRIDVEPMREAVPQPVGMVVNRPEGGVPMTVAPR